MRMIRSALALIIAVSALPVSAQETPPSPTDNALRLAPSMPWNLDYDDDSCALKRVFGEEGQQAYFELRQYDPHGDPQVIIGSADFAARSPSLAIGWLPGRSLPTLHVRSFELSGDSGYHGRLVSMPINVGFSDERARDIAVNSPLVTDDAIQLLDRFSELDPGRRDAQRLAEDDDFILARRALRDALHSSAEYIAERNEAEAEIRGLFVGEAFNENLILETGEMHMPMEAMRSCLDELVSHWGVDVEAHRNLSQRVRPADYARIVRSLRRAYPNRMQVQRQPGYIRARLDISPTGEPTGCHIQAPISQPDFEREACEQLVDEGEFYPALDEYGNPIASYYTVAIVYLPN